MSEALAAILQSLAGGGALLLVVVWGLIARGLLMAGSTFVRSLQLLGFLLISLPLFMRFYYTQSMILFFSILLCLTGGVIWLRKQMR